MMWDYFIYFAIASLLLWWGGAVSAFRNRKTLTYALTIAGLLIYAAFIGSIWITMQRPPLRTMGETRLWYAFFLPLAGIIVYGRWQYKWILSFSALLATVFTLINLLKPEIHSTTLMPALQSGWFAPHVIVYMFCYALLGAATLVAIAMLLPRLHYPLPTTHYSLLDQLVAVGLSFMTLGMLMGAFWAKEAWGHYWAWDPKETWAAITWLLYLGYIHMRRVTQKHPNPTMDKAALWLLILCFCCLQMCWWGINYLPSAQGVSVHTYGMK